MAQVSTKAALGVSGVTPPADQIPDLYGATTMANIDTKHIMATSPIGSTDLTLTDTSVEDSGSKLYSSYSDTVTESSQFPMQHATQHLPNKTVSLTTTDYIADRLISSVTAMSASTPDSMDATSGSANSSSSPASSSPQASYEGLTGSQVSSVISSTLSSSVGPSELVGSDSSAKDLLNNTPDLYSSYEPSVSELNSATEFLSSITSNVLLFTSTDNNQSESKHVLDSSKEMFIKVSHSVDYVPSTGELYSPITPSKTVFSTSEVPIDTSTFKSTPIVPFTPSGKPVNTVDPGGTALFGGGLTDYILYIGVPVCGLVILLFLIICLVCLKKRKNKHKGSPTKNHVQDLWVNSQQEIPLTTQDTLREANGGETIGGRQDLGCTTYEAVFDFQAELETHLTLKQGDLVRVHRKESNGWWRGTIGDKMGWFPNSYVQAAPQDKLETEDEIEMHSESNVSSFMVQPRHTPSFRDSLSIPSEKDIEAEPLYCKIQPKEKRKSFPKVPDKSPPKLAVPSRENTTTPIEDGSKYIAIYSYGGHFTGELTINKGDIIQGKELDRNGWMKGYNETTHQEGWCPTQYVDRLDKEEIKQLGPGPCRVPNSGSQNSLSPDPLTYKQLEANKNIDGIKDWVGIVHKAVHSYNAEKAGDLEFEEGDLVTVFQVLENGWWLGSKENVVGWFPGSYVKMIPQPSPILPCQRSASSPSNPSPTSESPISSDESKSVTDEGSDVTPTKPSKIRPVRKAPPPPLRLDKPINSSLSSPKSTEGSESKIPPATKNKAHKIPQPIRAAPPVPPGQNDSSDHSPLYESIGNDKIEHISGPTLIQTTVNDGLYESIEHTDGNDKKKQKEKNKPEVPKRYIQPKLVKVPRSEINIPRTAPPNGSPRGSGIARPRAPPPPRPIGPPKVPEVVSKVDKKQSNPDHPDQNEESLFFHLPPQSILNGIPRQESFEPEIDAVPYTSMSSFGSTFGKQEKKVENNDILVNSHNDELKSSQTYMDNFDQSELEKLKDDFKQPNMPDNVSSLEAVQPETDNSSQYVKPNESHFDRADAGEVETEKENMVQKKQKSGSRIPPPKHITLSNVENGNPMLDTETNDSKGLGKAVSKQSRIPMTRKESPAKHIDVKKSALNEAYNVSDAFNLVGEEVNKGMQVDERKINECAVIDYTDITENEDTKESQKEAVKDDHSDEPIRTRSESFNKPPVAPKPKSKGLPKLLPKPVDGSNSPDEPSEVGNNVDGQFVLEKTDSQVCAESDQKLNENNETKNKDSQRLSKLPKIAQKSPKMKKSGIPASPLMRIKNAEKQPKQSRKQNHSESDSDAPLSPTANQKNKQESPAMARRGAPKQIANNEKSIRNRSNSPHGRTGIPTSLRQRSSSPSSKSLKATNSPSPGSPSPTMTPSSIPKPSGLVQPKKIQTPKGGQSPGSEPSSSASTNQSPDTSFDNTDEDQDLQTASPKPDRPSKPPRVVKQKSQDGKPPKHSRSLLPVIHKTMDATNGVSPGNKSKSGIPVTKPGKQQASKASPEDLSNRGPTLFRAVRGYTAQTEEEMSFTEGTFVTELSDCDRVGWFVGMLADGTTGLYPADYFRPSLVSSQSEA